MTPMVVFDFETGGVEPRNPNIQLAAIALDEAGREVGVFEEKIQFLEEMCDPEALAMNHYDHDVWLAHAKPAMAVRELFADFLRRHAHVEMVSKRSLRPYHVAQLAGYNAATFDGPRLKTMFSDSFLPAHPRVLCILQRALWLSQEDPTFRPVNFQLSTVAAALGIDATGAHDALTDVRLAISVMKALTSALRRTAA